MPGPSFEIKNTIVRAGAGAGKTTELVQRVLFAADEFKARTGRFPHLIVTTFTRKATQELKERLLQKALELGRKDLEDFLKRPSQIHISTIHGVLSLFLSRFGSGIGLTPQFEIISAVQEYGLEKRVLRNLLKNQEFRDDFSDLQEICPTSDLLASFRDYFQSWCDRSDLQPISGLALSNLAEENWKSFLLLSLQFEQNIRKDTDNPKWLELASFLDRFIGNYKGQKYSDCRIAAMQSLEAVPSPQNRGQVISGATVDLREEWKEKKDLLESFPYRPEYWTEHGHVVRKFENLAQQFNSEILNEKIAAGQVSMSDLENFCLLLLRTSALSGQMFSQEWDYWLIDEYQDTAPRQVKMLQQLIGNSPRFLVGDPQQSIYLFRGARTEVFLEAEAWMTANQGAQLSKTINYRSQPSLLSFFNDFFSKIGNQFGSMQPDPAKVNNSVQSTIVADFLQVDAETSEYTAVLMKIQELLENKVDLGDIAVLSRNNRDLEKLAEESEKHGVSVQVYSNSKFYERREIVDALALLKFLNNPHDNLNFMQILRSPWCPMDDDDILSFTHSGADSFWRRSAGSSHPSLIRLREALLKTQTQGVGDVWLQFLKGLGFFDWSLQIDPTGRREANLWKLVNQVRILERRPGFSYLDFIQARDFAALDPDSGGDGDATPVIEPARVHLMTIHASKGLQFKHVILIGCGNYKAQAETKFLSIDDATGEWTLALSEPEEGKRSLSLLGRTMRDQRLLREREEYDRLLYVALTRAQQTVTLVWSEKPAEASWAHRFPIEQTEGDFSKGGYLYRVRKKDFSVRAHILDRPPFSAVKEKIKIQTSELGKVYSVTEILAVTNETKVKSAEQPEVAIGHEKKMVDPLAIRKALAGTDVHALFESLKFRQKMPELPEIWKNAMKFSFAWEQGCLQEIIKNGEVEWGFGISVGKNLLQGQIDLWGSDDRGRVWIIDYKTGSPTYQEKAFQQLIIYAYALQLMKKIPVSTEIQLAVIYPFSELVKVKTAPPFANCQTLVEELIHQQSI